MLKKLAKISDFPHLLFYGPNGAGKKTRVLAFLKEVYGPGVYTVTEEEKEYKINETSAATASCTVLSSKYHIDVAPSDADHHDKIII
jgi:replication factor C subunit 3/5